MDCRFLEALRRYAFYFLPVPSRPHLHPDTLKTTTPLVTKVLLEWLTETYYFHRMPELEREAAVQAGMLTRPRGVGFGIGLAVALFAMQGRFSVSPFLRILPIPELLLRVCEFDDQPLPATHNDHWPIYSNWSERICHQIYYHPFPY